MSADLSGTTIGQYQIQTCLARNDVAEVYRANQPQLKREVAIKRLLPPLAESPEVLDQFKRAVHMARLLQHQNIERVYDFFLHEHMPCKVMEFISGVTLKALIEELRSQGVLLPLPVVGNIIHQVASGLFYAHEQEQHPVHHGITTANIMIRMKPDTPDDLLKFVLGIGPSDVVLTDYLVAHVLHRGIQTISPDHVAGLTNYDAPELCQGKKGDNRSDIYSLGVVLYELLIGSVPFVADTPSQVMHLHINQPPTPPRTLRPDLSADIEQIVLKAIAKNPMERFYDAEAFGLAVKQRMGPMSPSLQFVPMGHPVAKADEPMVSPVVSASPAAPKPSVGPPASFQPKRPTSETAPPRSANKPSQPKAKPSAQSGNDTLLIAGIVVIMIILIGAIVWFLVL